MVVTVWGQGSVVGGVGQWKGHPSQPQRFPTKWPVTPNLTKLFNAGYIPYSSVGTGVLRAHPKMVFRRPAGSAAAGGFWGAKPNGSMYCKVPP